MNNSKDQLGLIYGATGLRVFTFHNGAILQKAFSLGELWLRTVKAAGLHWYSPPSGPGQDPASWCGGPRATSQGI